MTTTVQIIFYSMHGHIYRMAEAIAEGAREVSDMNVELYRVPELIPDDILLKSGAKEAQKAQAHIPIINVEQLTKADAYIFGCATRFGNISSPMRYFLDRLSSFWKKNTFADKVGSAFTSTRMQYDYQETTLAHFHSTLFHLGMLVTGSCTQEINELTSHATLAGNDAKRMPSETELGNARYQGKHVAQITRYLKSGRSI